MFLEASQADRADAADGADGSLPALPAAELERRTGAYRDTVSDAIVRVEARDGRLTAFLGGTTQVMTRVAPNGYRAGEAPYTFSFEGPASGPVARLYQVDREGDSTVYLRSEPPRDSRLEDYAGTFYSEELDVVYTVETNPMGNAMAGKPGLKLNRVPGSTRVTSIFWKIDG